MRSVAVRNGRAVAGTRGWRPEAWAGTGGRANLGVTTGVLKTNKACGRGPAGCRLRRCFKNKAVHDSYPPLPASRRFLILRRCIWLTPAEQLHARGLAGPPGLLTGHVAWVIGTWAPEIRLYRSTDQVLQELKLHGPS